MIRIQDLKKVYAEQVVLNGITTQIEKGQVVALLGSSGSGKSTLLRCMNRLEIPTSGHIFFDDLEVNEKNVGQIRQKVGMVFQNFQLFSNMSILQNLIYAPSRVKKIPHHLNLEKAMAYLKQVGLEKKASAFPKKLSGGEKQRAAIARTLMMDPEVILFDEPTSALDPEKVQEVLKVIKELVSTGITILIVTHEMNFVKDIASRVLFLDHGVILEDQNTKDFFQAHSKERIAQFLSYNLRSISHF